MTIRDISLRTENHGKSILWRIAIFHSYITYVIHRLYIQIYKDIHILLYNCPLGWHSWNRWTPDFFGRCTGGFVRYHSLFGMFKWGKTIMMNHRCWDSKATNSAKWDQWPSCCWCEAQSSERARSGAFDVHLQISDGGEMWWICNAKMTFTWRVMVVDGLHRFVYRTAVFISYLILSMKSVVCKRCKPIKFVGNESTIKHSVEPMKS